ncbi:response regulator transcription factor [Anaerobacillus sp. CMMVII]|uniref:response regulator transcription factor n=1 Tax=Anaerobacillus sp. CMMVII TaxID=2755588 RepID=UPI0028E0A0BF|nr:response regulator transcription factor [Anaerobacillus sp. CMMVII]
MMKKTLKVLIIEDDPYIRDIIRLYIEKQGYTAVEAQNGEEGLQVYFDESPNFIVLDIMLPEMSGWEVCKEIRRDNLSIPIIMLTGKGESYDKIKGLNLGADDYIVKPFDPNELIARIKAVLRRTNFDEGGVEVIQLPSLSIDMKQFKVSKGEVELILAPKEQELLYFFAKNQNQIFTRQQLLDQLWGYEFDGDPRTVDVHVKRLREKLGDPLKEWSIKTVWGIGYKFEVNFDE